MARTRRTESEYKFFNGTVQPGDRVSFTYNNKFRVGVVTQVGGSLTDPWIECELSVGGREGVPFQRFSVHKITPHQGE